MDVFKQIPLYRFLMFCNESVLEKQILDCGAGGDFPPLSLFYESGYDTYGVEFDQRQKTKALRYAKSKEQDLKIEQGDMRHLTFKDNYFSFVYSYNSIFHMTKDDVAKSMEELKRVLKPEGLLFVNFLSTEDFRCGIGKAVGSHHEYEQDENEMQLIHSYFETNEADSYFDEMDIIYKETRVVERIYEGEKIKQGFVDYIAKKR
ncbi:MAG: class I SAM-dependent methyltransferase [Turicibacter sp.]